MLVAAIVCLVVSAPGVAFADAAETGEFVLATAVVDVVTISAQAVAAAEGVLTILSVAAGGDFVAVE